MSEFGKIRMVVGVCGGISSMGSPHVLYWLKQKLNLQIQVILSPAAHRFVTPESFSDLLHQRPLTTAEDLAPGESHVSLARNADVIVLLPATANTLVKLSVGLGDNLLCSTVMAADCPVFLMPATSEITWNKPAVQRAVEQLRKDGYTVVDPGPGASLATGEREVGSLGDFRKPLLEAVVAAASRSNEGDGQ
ncbi:flavoprotein [Streptomyces sp. NPDC059452]|uniref:flavoprotein n=1 Tax=Streptomyces sp. NPDC059452 TaxID=3346835 RepID=UPI0036D1235A